MDQQATAELYEELRQQALASMKRTEEIVRKMNDEYYRAEQAKRDIASYYRRRRLQRQLGITPVEHEQ